MKRPAYRITLDTPCTQDWDDLDPQGAGRFCASCNRCVLDFTNASDAAIVRHLQQHGTACGRLRADQLDRLLLGTPAPVKPLWARAAAALLLLFASRNADAKPGAVIPTEQAPSRNTGAFPGA
ncbi:MAG: hypothetical protein EOO11_17310, partial [Chitinophagaceae bacterium]